MIVATFIVGVHSLLSPTVVLSWEKFRIVVRNMYVSKTAENAEKFSTQCM